MLILEKNLIQTALLIVSTLLSDSIPRQGLGKGVRTRLQP